MKKILISVNGFFPATRYGGPPVSVNNLCNLLHDKAQFYIVTRNHDKNSKAPLETTNGEWTKYNHANILYLPDKEINYHRYKKIIKEIKPDLIYINSLFDAIHTVPLLELATKYRIRVLLAPRGELCKNAFQKKYKKIPYLFVLKKYWENELIEFHSTSDEETEAIHRILKVDYKRIHLLDNIPTIQDKFEAKKEKKENQISVIFLSRIHPKKNLLFALDCLKDIVDGEVIFDIYGPIEDKEYWIRCEQYIKKMAQNVVVTYKGVAQHNNVQNIIHQYDLFFFPTLSENFGHVIAEALFASVPILISDQTPWNDVGAHKAGKALALNQKELFVEYIKELQKCTHNEWKIISKNAERYIHDKTKLEELKETYCEVIDV